MDLTTARLRLRRWREEDLEPFATMNADPEVMHHFPKVLTRTESDTFARRIEEGFAIWGFGLWAVEEKESGSFGGFVGLWPVAFEAHFTPAVEVGWRLARPMWGKGYATEAAERALDYAFREVRLAEIVSFTIPANAASRRVMEKVGMTHDPKDDFDHPRLDQGSPFRRHVLYRKANPKEVG